MARLRISFCQSFSKPDDSWPYCVPILSSFRVCALQHSRQGIEVHQNHPSSVGFYDEIKLYYKGGSIIAQRSESANTTTELRKKNFSLIIAPGLDGSASGRLYLDDGVSIVQKTTTYIEFSYSKDGTFAMNGHFGYDPEVYIESIVVLGSGSEGKQVLIHEPISLSDRYSIQT